MWSQMESKSGDEPLKEAKNKFCVDLPNPLNKECAAYVDSKGRGILRLVAAGWDAERICTQFASCAPAVDPGQPPSGIEQNGHIDEDDMPAPDELNKPELVKNRIDVPLEKLFPQEKRGEKDPEEWSLLEVGTEVQTGDMGTEMRNSMRAVRFMWRRVYDVAYAWSRMHKKSNAASNAAAATSAAIQIEAGSLDTCDEAEQFIAAVSKENNSQFNYNHVNLLHSMLQTMDESYTSGPLSNTTQPSSFIQLGIMGPIEPSTAGKELADRLSDSARSLLQVQLQSKLELGAGKSRMWRAVGYVWWSLIFTDYIMRMMTAN